MSLMIPTIGTEIRLLEDWTFRLFAENRNSKFAELVGAPWMGATRTGWYEDIPGAQPNAWGHTRQRMRHMLLTLPAGTKLTVDRIYIRKGDAKMKEFDSITFRIPRKTGKAGKTQQFHGRSWAKLADANVMRCGFVESTLPDAEGRALQTWEQALVESVTVDLGEGGPDDEFVGG